MSAPRLRYPALFAHDAVPDREAGVTMGSAFAASLLIAGVVEHASPGGGFPASAAIRFAALGGFALVQRRRARYSYRDRQRPAYFTGFGNLCTASSPTLRPISLPTSVEKR